MPTTSYSQSSGATKKPKIVLIGAGSAFFGRQTIWSMIQKQALQNGCLALAETDPVKLSWLKRLAERAIEATGSGLQLLVSDDYRTLLKDADFVILAFAVEGVSLRGIDADISTRHGMIMCSADTIGPGGIMRTIREVPRQHEILSDVRRYCPDAWVINWVNPTAAMGIAMMRHFPDLRTIAICDGPHNPHFDNKRILEAGIVSSVAEISDSLRSKVLIRSGGVNHFNWLVEMRYNGEDMLPKVAERLKSASQEEHVAAAEENKVKLTNQISWELTRMIGYPPMCIWHTQEYFPYFQGHDVRKEDALTIKKWRIDVRKQWMQDCWRNMEGFADGSLPITAFLEKTRPDHASDIIEAMWAGETKKFYINTRNGGAVTNMPEDAYLEIPCLIDMNRIQPLPFGEMPRPILGFLHRVLDEHELAVEAAMTCDVAKLRQSFLASMLAVSLPDVEACIEELLAAQRDYLPVGWNEGRKKYVTKPSNSSVEMQMDAQAEAVSC